MARAQVASPILGKKGSRKDQYRSHGKVPSYSRTRITFDTSLTCLLRGGGGGGGGGASRGENRIMTVSLGILGGKLRGDVPCRKGRGKGQKGGSDFSVLRVRKHSLKKRGVERGGGFSSRKKECRQKHASKSPEVERNLSWEGRLNQAAREFHFEGGRPLEMT